MEKLKGDHHRYFSEDFKRNCVRELDNKLYTIADISREYNVSRTTVYRWLENYSVHYKRKSKVVVEMESEALKSKKLKERIAELERSLGQKQMELDYFKKLIELANEEHGLDIEKKVDVPPSNGSAGTEGSTTAK